MSINIERLADMFGDAITVTHDPLTEAISDRLLTDHDERVTTGIVRPAVDRAAELAATVRPVIYREAARRLLPERRLWRNDVDLERAADILTEETTAMTDKIGATDD